MQTFQRMVEVGERDWRPLSDVKVQHEVVEVVHQTNAAGAITFATDGISASIRKAAGVPLPVNVGLTASDDEWDELFCAFVVQVTAGADAGKHFVGICHPDLGAKLQPSSPALTLDETFTCAWTFGMVTLQEDGAGVNGGRASIQVVFTTAEGDVTFDVGANKYYNLTWDGTAYVSAGTSTGEWLTDASGVLGTTVPGKAHGTAYFPLWPGNVWHTDPQSEKVWAGSAARESDEYMSTMKVWHKGQYVEVSPGVGGTINAEKGTMNVSGEPGATVQIEIEGANTDMAGAVQGTGLDGSGNAVFSQLAPGRWAAWQYEPSEHSGIAPRQWVNVNEGATANVTLGGFMTPAAGSCACYAYYWGAEPAANAIIYERSGTAWVAYGTTDGNGHWEGTVPDVPGTPMLAMLEPLYGYQRWRYNIKFESTWMFSLGGVIVHPYQGLMDIGDDVHSQWWDVIAGDPNIPGPGETALIVREANDATAITGLFSYDGWQNLVSTPVPRSASGSSTQYSWRVEKPDGTVVRTLGSLAEDGLYHGVEDLLEVEKCVMGRTWAGPPIGARIHGEMTHEYTTAQIGDGAEEEHLYEAGRMLERGGWQPWADLRFHAKELGRTVRAGAAQGQVCSYHECRGPVWRWPTESADVVHGYCQNCGTQTNWGPMDMDCRTFFMSACLPGFE